MNSKYSNDFRPYYISIRKEEEKGEKLAKINLELKHNAIPEPWNPFVKKTVFTQTYPTCLIPAAPRKACCFECSWSLWTLSQWHKMHNLSIPLNRKTKLIKKNDRPLVFLLCTFLIKAFGGMLGASIRILICHKLSSNVYLFGLQAYKHLSEYFNFELTEFIISNKVLENSHSSVSGTSRNFVYK